MTRSSHPPSARAQVSCGTPLGEALDHSIPLALLMQRVQAARQRLATLRPLLPDALAGTVRAGPLDDLHWTLLADSSATAAKLRQMLPQLDSALVAAGFAPLALRVKVLPRARR
jgi:protein gp37